MQNPLISFIVTTRNSARTAGACFKSIKNQVYSPVELIVVDNSSTDGTYEIAKTIADQVIVAGPERSAQRNIGIAAAKGEYVVIIDSDMILSPTVAGNCLNLIQSDSAISGIFIPEESIGAGFWSECKRLERSFYNKTDWVLAARFFPKSLFERIENYDLKLTGCEDWDMSVRAGQAGKLISVNDLIRHDEGPLKLSYLLKKKYYYTKKSINYIESSRPDGFEKQTSVLARYKLLLGKPEIFIKKPAHSLGMIFMKTMEFAACGFGYLAAKLQKHE